MKNFLLTLFASLFLLLGACASTPTPEEEAAADETTASEQGSSESGSVDSSGSSDASSDASSGDSSDGSSSESGATGQDSDATVSSDQVGFAAEDETQILIDEALELINRDGVVYFDFDDFSLRSDSLETLDEVVPFVLQVLELSPNSEVFIGGHTDERGTPEYNLGLGARRSEAVGRYLRTNGISAESINTTSFGESEPIDPGHNEEAWSLNRRAEISVIIN